AQGHTAPAASTPGRVTSQPGAALAAYGARYVTGFGPHALSRMRIGVYQHSSVARDVLMQVLADLGATPVAIARSDTFVPVDTEAVDPDTRAQLARWCHDHNLDALVSTDGDADRPMVTDATGTIVPGDVLGVLTAQMLGAGVICTPVSSNSMVDDLFDTVVRTRIGSPYVIAAMENTPAGAPVIGYEANGGFLLGFAAQGPAGPLAPLMTRDCLLPMIAPLAAARGVSGGMAALVATLPARFTAADRLQGIAPDRAAPWIARLADDPAARAAVFAASGPVAGVDTTDGLRVRFADNRVVHLRPSGNAPELRCYTEAASPQAAQDLLADYLGMLRATFP
ncbi:MAG: phosphomannomutase, partial [Primorskyibacter sp.]